MQKTPDQLARLIMAGASIKLRESEYTADQLVNIAKAASKAPKGVTLTVNGTDYAPDQLIKIINAAPGRVSIILD